MMRRHPMIGSLAVLLLAIPAAAIDVVGVLPASLDQPRVYLALSTTARSEPIAVKQQAALAGLEALRELGLADGGADEPAFAVEAFLDTGASGVMLSKITSEALGLVPLKARDGSNVQFYDVGVAGMEAFDVSAPLFLRVASYGGTSDGGNLSNYAAPVGPIHLKLRGEGGLLDQMTGGLDVAGMPVMLGRVMVIDARPLRDMSLLNTRLVAPGDRSIPRSDATVRLTYIDFSRFTTREPANAPGATLAPNPMIGPNPFNKADRTPGIVLRHGQKSTTRTMLLDTGASSSFISSDTARSLGIERDAAGNFVGVPAADQFSLPIGGIGGIKTVRGLYLDAVELPVTAGEPVRYRKVPFLVLDISVEDQGTGETYTLDGVLGMNLFVASASVTGGAMAGVDEVRDGAFDFISIDHGAGTLGLTVRK